MKNKCIIFIFSCFLSNYAFASVIHKSKFIISIDQVQMNSQFVLDSTKIFLEYDNFLHELVDSLEQPDETKELTFIIYVKGSFFKYDLFNERFRSDSIRFNYYSFSKFVNYKSYKRSFAYFYWKKSRFNSINPSRAERNQIYFYDGTRKDFYVTAHKIKVEGTRISPNQYLKAIGRLEVYYEDSHFVGSSYVTFTTQVTLDSFNPWFKKYYRQKWLRKNIK